MKEVEMGYNICHMECVEPAEARVTYGNFPKYHTKILLSYCNTKIGEKVYFQTNNSEREFM